MVKGPFSQFNIMSSCTLDPGCFRCLCGPVTAGPGGKGSVLGDARGHFIDGQRGTTSVAFFLRFMTGFISVLRHLQPHNDVGNRTERVEKHYTLFSRTSLKLGTENLRSHDSRDSHESCESCESRE